MMWNRKSRYFMNVFVFVSHVVIHTIVWFWRHEMHWWVRVFPRWLQKAALHCEIVVRMYSKIYHPMHPMTALQLSTLGNLRVEIGDVEKGLKELECSSSIRSDDGFIYALDWGAIRDASTNHYQGYNKLYIIYFYLLLLFLLPLCDLHKRTQCPH